MCSLGFRLSGPFDVPVNLRAFSRHASGFVFVDGWLDRLLALALRSSLPLDRDVRQSLSSRKVVPESAYGGKPAPDVECVAVPATSLGAGGVRGWFGDG